MWDLLVRRPSASTLEARALAFQALWSFSRGSWLGSQPTLPGLTDMERKDGVPSALHFDLTLKPGLADPGGYFKQVSSSVPFILMFVTKVL